MPYQRLSYQFTTRLAASRPEAYRWATDYRSDDFARGGLRGSRKVEQLADDLVLLTDSLESDPFDSSRRARTVKVKLVHLFPDRWRWTSTHLSGPAKYSQFLYELSPRGPAASELLFTGSQVERVDARPSAASLRRRTRELRREDSQLWARLSTSLANEL